LTAGKSFSSSGDFVFVGYGLADDFKKTNVKGKIVVAYSGTNESTPGQQAFRVDSPAKYKLVKDNGGLALIEIINFNDVPWEGLVGIMAGSKVIIRRIPATSLDFEYVEKFIRAFVYSASLLADSPNRPYWKAGDKFESAGKTLYGIK
jgi:hypothetical protein